MGGKSATTSPRPPIVMDKPRQFFGSFARLLAISILCVCPGFVLAALPVDEIEFNRDVRPILSDHCFTCHGPDAARRQADLRLDLEANAKWTLDGRSPIVPGEPSASELIRRVTSHDPEVRMPPPEAGKQLSAEEAELLTRWIRQGARWQRHWAWIPPRRAKVPTVDADQEIRNPIDAFVLERLKREGLSHASPAERTTLLRRVTLDLTGLPPTPEETDRFLADAAPDAYERAVDRLLASPRYGERMASRWLDAARYADTSGYQTDGIRHMWRWRDWVIEAFNRNLPFDTFTIEQIAGDMLNSPTLEQRIATGFNRNHRGNAEGGIIPEEYAVEYVIDRVDTTATVWLGLTMGCARCHDHKFDPITHKEFYQVFALFNNVPEKGRAIKVGNSPPMIKAPTRDQQKELRELEDHLAAAGRAWQCLESEIDAGLAAWASSAVSAANATDAKVDWAPDAGLIARFPLDDDARDAVSGKLAEVTGSLEYHQAACGAGGKFDGSSCLTAGTVADFGYFDKFTIAAWIHPARQRGTVVAKMAEQADADGYSITLDEGRLQVSLVKRWLDDALIVRTAEPLSGGGWRHVTVTYDGSRAAEGVKIYVDGRPSQVQVLLDELNQTFNTTEPLRIGGGGPAGRFAGGIDEVRIYKRALAEEQISLLATRDTIDQILAIAPPTRSSRQSAKLRAYYLEHHAEQRVRSARSRRIALLEEIAELNESLPTTMVMEEMNPPRESFVLARGQYDKPLERVSPDLPAFLPALDASAPKNRLSFARWLVSPENPLTARVAINRMWQSLFGAGLVKTVDDFGAQGDPPSHPELLDWLACEFMESGWDVKAILRMIVTSATYRQSSRANALMLERDPHNRLLARGPRFRLSAEAIRDQALFASGLLVERQGGPSVIPYQPAGLWKELTGGGDFVQDHGADLYRRSLYTFWKRTIAPPSMMTFDASSREACWVRETRTNTPLQALALLNEITFVEAARALAERVMHEGAASSDDRIERLFRLATGRNPRPQELTILQDSWRRQRTEFEARPEAADKLLNVGESILDADLDRCELAAYACLANLVLNLDEVITKQ